MNKPLRKVSVFCLLLIAALMLRMNYVQVVKADEYAHNVDNRRAIYEMYSHPRGNFLVDNEPITGSRKTSGDRLLYERTYVNGPMYAQITGYKSPYMGSTLLENVYNDVLTGEDDRLFVRRVIDVVTGKDKRGGDVALTINKKAQEAAFGQLKDKRGAVVAIDPTTGKILAMTSTPTFDPGVLSSNDNNAAAAAAQQLEADRTKPLDNRPIRTTYAPGSTFKLITAAAALSSGKYDVNTPTTFPSPLPFPESTKDLRDHGNLQCTGKTLKEAMDVSCNTVFGGIGKELGPEAIQKQAEAFGFNNFGKGNAADNANDLFVPTRVVPSVFPTGLNGAQTMLSSIGQFDVQATPMQMAMMTAAIVNNGKVMQPYVVDELRAANGSVIEKTQPKQLSQAVTPEVASKLREMMESVVKNGTGKNAQIGGVTVGGKTGTAENGERNEGTPYAWFVSYAEKDGKKVAVAVVVEDPGELRKDENVTGGGLAAPIAKSVMQAVLGK